MKKTLTVNLGGTVFHIDEDAYQLLDKYLSNLRIHNCWTNTCPTSASISGKKKDQTRSWTISRCVSPNC